MARAWIGAVVPQRPQRRGLVPWHDPQMGDPSRFWRPSCGSSRIERIVWSQSRRNASRERIRREVADAERGCRRIERIRSSAVGLSGSRLGRWGLLPGEPPSSRRDDSGCRLAPRTGRGTIRSSGLAELTVAVCDPRDRSGHNPAVPPRLRNLRHRAVAAVSAVSEDSAARAPGTRPDGRQDGCRAHRQPPDGAMP